MELSVIIPAYNEEKCIEETLKSINGAETIVVCNGCTDNTPSIAEKFADKVIVLEERGVSKARNAGAEAALHNRLVFLDADILVDGKLLEEIKNAKYNIGTCKVKPNSNKTFDKLVMGVKSYVHYLGTCTGLIFCDKVVFDRAGGFEENLSKKEDGRFLRRGIRKGSFGVVNAYVYNNMRRFREQGYIPIAYYWIREYVLPSKKEYKSIR